MLLPFWMMSIPLANNFCSFKAMIDLLTLFCLCFGFDWQHIIRYVFTVAHLYFLLFFSLIMLHVASISFTFPQESSHFTSDGDSGYVAFGMSVFALDLFLFGKTKLKITAKQ